MSDYTINQGKLIYDDATGFFYEYEAANAENPEQLNLAEHPEHYDYFWGTANQTDKPAERASQACIHEPVEYIGFNDAYMYCKKCNEKL